MSTKLLVKGNTKLGPDIWTWSIDHSSCIAKTAVCNKICYVKDYMSRYKAVQPAYVDRMVSSLAPSFTADMIAEIVKCGAGQVRIHVCGDFYSLEYLQKWIDIASQMSNCTFSCFTRVWKLPDFTPKLAEFGALSNVKLILSLDQDNVKIPVPGALNSLKTAYLSLNDADLPPAGTFVDFRHERKTLQYKLNGVRVCPHEYSNSKKHKAIKCSRCLKCYK